MLQEMSFANKVLFTDVFPFEIVEHRTEKKLIIRPMNAEPDETWKPEVHPGGFAQHISNQSEQSYLYSSIPDGQLIDIRLHKDGKWRDKHGNRYQLSENPVYFHDYNF